MNRLPNRDEPVCLLILNLERWEYVGAQEVAWEMVCTRIGESDWLARSTRYIWCVQCVKASEMSLDLSDPPDQSDRTDRTEVTTCQPLRAHRIPRVARTHMYIFVRVQPSHQIDRLDFTHRIDRVDRTHVDVM